MNPVWRRITGPLPAFAAVFLTLATAALAAPPPPADEAAIMRVLDRYMDALNALEQTNQLTFDIMRKGKPRKIAIRIEG